MCASARGKRERERGGEGKKRKRVITSLEILATIHRPSDLSHALDNENKARALAAEVA